MSNRQSTASNLDMGHVPHLWQTLEWLDTHVEEAEQQYRCTNILTDRRLDEATRTGQRLYIQCSGLLAVARDHQEAVEQSMQFGVRPFALWSLLRPSFEAAFWVLWMLEPEDRRERLRRGLRVAWREQKEHEKFYRLSVEIAGAKGEDFVLKREAQSRAICKKYEEEAHAVHMSTKDMGKPVIVTEELGKLQSTRDPDNPTAHLLFKREWKELSGLEHGDATQLAGVSDAEYHVKIPGGSTATISVSDNAFQQVCGLTAAIQMLALRLYLERTTELTR